MCMSLYAELYTRTLLGSEHTTARKELPSLFSIAAAVPASFSPQFQSGKKQ
jgi:hypothetical protein